MKWLICAALCAGFAAGRLLRRRADVSEAEFDAGMSRGEPIRLVFGSTDTISTVWPAGTVTSGVTEAIWTWPEDGGRRCS